MIYEIGTNLYFLFVLITSMVGSMYYRSQAMLIARTIISLLIIFVSGIGINKKLRSVLIIWILFVLICSIISNHFAAGPLIRFISMFLESYILLRLFKQKFTEIYVKWILVFSMISLIGWCLSVINIEWLISFLSPINISGGYEADSPIGLYIHTGFYTINWIPNDIWGLSLPRNAGFCWEPGGFSLLVVLAIYINFILKKENILSWKNILLFVTLLTTFSTTGYLALLGLLIYEYSAKRKSLFSIISLVVIIILSYHIFFRYQFLSGKVSAYSEMRPYVTSTPTGDVLAGSRIAGYSLVLQDLKKNPLFGKALISTGNYGEYGEIITWHLNSIYTITSTMGLVGLLLWLWFVVNSSKSLSKIYNHYSKYGFLIFIILSSFGFNVHSLSIIFTFATYGYFIPTTYKITQKASGRKSTISQEYNKNIL